MTTPDDTEDVPPSDKGRAPLALRVRCKNCLYFQDGVTFGPPSKRQPCSALGVKSFARPCPRFVSNPYAFKNLEDSYQLITQMLKGLKTSRVVDMTAMFNQEIKTRQQGFILGQIVYVKMFGDDYITNYARAQVIQATKDHVFVVGFTKKKPKGFRGTLLHKSVLTEELFEKKKQRLLRAGKIRDPKLEQYTKWKPVIKRGKDPLKDYVAPNIDALSPAPAPKTKRVESKDMQVIRTRGGKS